MDNFGKENSNKCLKRLVNILGTTKIYNIEIILGQKSSFHCWAGMPSVFYLTDSLLIDMDQF